MAVAGAKTAGFPRAGLGGEVLRPPRTLLLGRREAKRLEALKQLQKVYEGRSSEILAEVERYGKAAGTGRPLWQRLRLRPFVGYRAACAALYRTMVEHVLPAQEGTTVVVQQRNDDDGNKRVRYVLRDDATEGVEEEEEDAGEQASEEDAAKSMAMADPASMARALFVLLRQLAGSTPWALEAAAAESSNMSPEKWQERTPDLETPKYEV